MTFDLSPELTSVQRRAREVADSVVREAAAAIDASGSVPAAVVAAIEPLGLATADPLAAAVALEELAAVSAAAAAHAAVGGDAPASNLAGLRGVPQVASPASRHYLALAAVCLGIGRAALDEALRVCRTRGDRPAGDPDAAPHWALADAATEVDAARLLVHATASGTGLPPSAVHVFTAATAVRAVDAALRIVGPDGYAIGSVLERAARDARAATLILGTEDDARLAAALAMLEGA